MMKREYDVAGLGMNMTKGEYFSVGAEEICDLVLEVGKIKGVQSYKFLGVILNKKGIKENEIRERINKGRVVNRNLNSFFWQKPIQHLR